MIANAKLLSRASSRTAALHGSAQEGERGDGETHIWNCLFQGSLQIQLVRLRFHNTIEIEDMTVLALDLRPEGWVVAGIQCDSGQPIEHALTRIREVEVLGESVNDAAEAMAELPPLA